MINVDRSAWVYSLTASGPKGELFLVTDGDGINVGYAREVGGLITSPTVGGGVLEAVYAALMNDPEGRVVLDRSQRG